MLKKPTWYNYRVVPIQAFIIEDSILWAFFKKSWELTIFKKSDSIQLYALVLCCVYFFYCKQ